MLIKKPATVLPNAAIPFLMMIGRGHNAKFRYCTMIVDKEGTISCWNASDVRSRVPDNRLVPGDIVIQIDVVEKTWEVFDVQYAAPQPKVYELIQR